MGWVLLNEAISELGARVAMLGDRREVGLTAVQAGCRGPVTWAGGSKGRVLKIFPPWLGTAEGYLTGRWCGESDVWGRAFWGPLFLPSYTPTPFCQPDIPMNPLPTGPEKAALNTCKYSWQPSCLSLLWNFCPALNSFRGPSRWGRVFGASLINIGLKKIIL